MGRPDLHRGSRSCDDVPDMPTQPTRSSTSDPEPTTAPPALHVLVVEDDPVDASLVRAVLTSANRALIHSTVTTTFDGAVTELRSGSYDVVLLDLGLPDSEGLSTLSRITNASPDTPVVVLSGVDDPSLERETVISGAQDFIPKQLLAGDHSLAARTLSRSLVASVDRHAIARLAHAGEDNLRRIVDEHPECILVLDHEGKVLLANQAANNEIAGGIDLRGVTISTGPVGKAASGVVQAHFGEAEFELTLRRSTWYGQTAWLAALRQPAPN